jgi:hypothetical protein
MLSDTEESHLTYDRERRRRKIAEETNNDRERRLTCDQERKRRRKNKETNEEREERLARDRERKRRRTSEESIEERKARLARDRERKRRKANEETNKEREARLEAKEECRRVHARKKYSLRRVRETPKQVAARISQQSSKRRKRATDSIPNADQKLLRQFWNTMNNIRNNQYNTCNERFPSIVLIRDECHRCYKEKKPKRFSDENNMDPGGY